MFGLSFFKILDKNFSLHYNLGLKKEKSMLEIFSIVFTDFNFLSAFFQTIIIIFLGFLFMKLGIVDSSGKKTVTALIWKLAVPCFAFNAFMQDFELQRFKASLVEFFLAVFFYILLILIGKLLFLKKGKDISTISALFMAIGQTTLFSMPILQSVYESRGNEVMLYISTVSIVFRIFVYIIGYSLISGEKITLSNFGQSMKKVFLNPVMIGMFLGILVFLIQNITPQVQVQNQTYSIFRVDKTLPVLYVTVRSLARMVSPLCMFMIGMSIGEAKFSECIKDGYAWALAVLRNILGPVVVAAVCFIIHKTGLFHFDEYSLITIIVAFSAPISVSLSIMCVQANKEEQLATRACLISTLLTLITFPLSFVLGHLVLRFL